MVAEVEACLPFTSVTVSKTRLLPRLEPVKVAEGEILYEAIPQLSLDPLSKLDPGTVIVPEGGRYTVIFLETTVGGVLSITRI